MYRSNSVDSLDGEEPGLPEGKINIQNGALLSQLMLQSNSPLPVFKSAQEKTYASKKFSSEMKKELDDLDEFKYIDPNIDDDSGSHDLAGLSSRTVTLAPAAPELSKSPIQVSRAHHFNSPPAVNTSEKSVPPLLLTDSLIADDPEPNAARVVRDSLDSSFDEEDYQRLQNLMSSAEPLPNPFVTEQPTPTTMKLLDISGALAVSATPQQVHSQMSRAQVSVLSSYAEADEDATPRAEGTHRPSEAAEAPQVQDRPTSYLDQYGAGLEKPAETGNSENIHNHNHPFQSNSSEPQPPYQYESHQRQANQENLASKQSGDNWGSMNGNVQKQSPRLKPLQAREESQLQPATQSVGTVAPKPPPANTNFIEKNIEKARGVNSAKASYTSRLMQAKKEQEKMKVWAPGMVVPRKKAASADNSVRQHKNEEEDLQPASLSLESGRQAFSTEHLAQAPPESVWEQRATQLADAKLRNTGRQSKKPPRKPPAGEYEPAVRVEASLRPANSFAPAHQGMKLIGPIPQPSAPGYIHPASRGYGAQALGGVQSVPPPAGSVYEHPPATGPIKRPVLTTGPTPNPAIPAGPVVYPEHPSYSSHPTYNSYPAPSQPYPTNLAYISPRSEVMTSNPDQTASTSYHQYYLQGQPSHNLDHSSTSRWNAQKPPHFVESDIDVTLDEVRALEEGGGYQNVLERKSSSPGLNPYQAVPPINNEEPAAGAAGAAVADRAGGYSQMHQLQKEKGERRDPNYKTYTLTDYKKINKNIKLGGLGPSVDPTVLREKHEKRQKQLQYAREAREMEAKKAQVKPRAAVQTEGEEKKSAAPSGRQLAKEYAKTVPKPRVAPKPEPQNPSLNSARSVHSDASSFSRSQSTSQLGPFGHEKTIPHSYSMPTIAPAYQSQPSVERVDMGDLMEQFTYADTIEALHRRHLEEKQLIATIKHKI